jgi:DnaD/phage-associated family protein
LGEYVLHLPEDESIVLSGPASRRLLQAGDGDAALLYIAVLRNKGAMDEDKLRGQLSWGTDRFRSAVGTLERQGLISRPGTVAPPSNPEPRQERPEYTRADTARAMEGDKAFRGLTGAVEGRLGKKLTHPDTQILLGLYDFLGLPADVIYLLVGFCCERSAQQYGPGRRPTMRQIEREGYAWARMGLMTQESAAAHIKKVQQSQEKLPRLMALLGLGERRPSPSEEKYLMAWSEMNFEDGAIVLAYDKTILKCKELKWPYMNKILTSWHQKGLHTVKQVQEGDRPAPRRTEVRKPPEEEAKAEMQRMEKYLQQLRRQREGDE